MVKVGKSQKTRKLAHLHMFMYTLAYFDTPVFDDKRMVSVVCRIDVQFTAEPSDE